MFRDPWYLLLALPALALAGAAYAFGFRRRARLLALLGDTPTLRRLLPPEAGGRRKLQAGLRLAALAMLALALAGPQWGVELVETSSQARSVMIAVDVSLSMLTEDVKPSRLARAKDELSLLIDELRGSRIGVIAFAGEPVVICPLTTDAAAAKQLLRSLEPGSAPVPGTGIGKAIRRATQALARYPGSKALVLLTDGEDHRTEPVKAAEQAAGEGVRVFTIGIGSAEGEPIPLKDAGGAVTGYKKDKNGRTVVSRLGEADLAAVAEKAGGAYYKATPGAGEAAEIARRLEGGGSGEEATPGTTRRYSNRFLGPLTLAFLLLLLEWLIPETRAAGAPARPGAGVAGSLAALLLLALASPSRAAGGEAALRRGNKLYDREQYEPALKQYEEAGRRNPKDARPAFNAGDALYRLENYDQATEAFRAVAESGAAPSVRAGAYYNLGNAQYQKGDYKAAVDAYRRAVTLDPQDAQARLNLAVALRRLKNPPPKKDDKDKKGQDKKNPPPPKPQDKPESKPQGGQPPPPKTKPQDQMSKEDAERIMRAVSEREKAPPPTERGPSKRPPSEEDW